MGFYQITEQMIGQAFTEKGDKAFLSTGSACLDFFSLVGGMRNNIKDSLKLFMKSYYENPLITIKLLFYVRDIRGGLGERSIFRYILNSLANMYPNVAKQLIEYIPQYGRYDDLLVCLKTPIKKEVINYIKVQLEKDIEAKNNNKPISLLAKWLPSINTSSDEARELANILAEGLSMSKEKYRKTLSFLRKGLIIENNIREKDFTFDYETVPGGAMFKYRNIFYNEDDERFNKYLEDVSSGKRKMNTKQLFPYEIIRKFENEDFMEEEQEEILDIMWKNFDRTNITSKTIVVRDGSGSMYDENPVTANSIATSLAILFAEQLTGEFKDTFITFSAKPRIIKIKGDTIAEKYWFIERFSDASTTNISSVYQLILDVYKHKDFKVEDALERIVIISDMEFDEIRSERVSTYEYFKNEFDKLGYKIPEVVFWNVNARHIHFPVTNIENVKLISGASPKIIEMISESKAIVPYDLMLECLEKYSCFDTIKF